MKYLAVVMEIRRHQYCVEAPDVRTAVNIAVNKCQDGEAGFTVEAEVTSFEVEQISFQ